jgi:hypothetical protein
MATAKRKPAKRKRARPAKAQPPQTRRAMQPGLLIPGHRTETAAELARRRMGIPQEVRLGNHLAGRPREWTEDLVNAEAYSLLKYVDELPDGESSGMLLGYFCWCHGYTLGYLYKLAREWPVIKRAMDAARDLQRTRIKQMMIDFPLKTRCGSLLLAIDHGITEDNPGEGAENSEQKLHPVQDIEYLKRLQERNEAIEAECREMPAKEEVKS